MIRIVGQPTPARPPSCPTTDNISEDDEIPQPCSISQYGGTRTSRLIMTDCSNSLA